MASSVVLFARVVFSLDDVRDGLFPAKSWAVLEVRNSSLPWENCHWVAVMAVVAIESSPQSDAVSCRQSGVTGRLEH